MIELDVQRVGSLTGRWPSYRLIVNGVDVGEVKRVISYGRDGLRGRRQPRYDSWAIRGTHVETREEAEKKLIERALRFGYLTVPLESHSLSVHQPTRDCDGKGFARCAACRKLLCNCERVFGHDCEG
jgi:hypothetical protein